MGWRLWILNISVRDTGQFIFGRQESGEADGLSAANSMAQHVAPALPRHTWSHLP
jgi:hypothetical protein